MQSAGLLVVEWRTIGRRRAVLRAALLLTLFFAMVSIPLAHRGLETSLMLAQTSNNAGAPPFIFVLPGGYSPGVTADDDVLTAESSWRVLSGSPSGGATPTRSGGWQHLIPDAGTLDANTTMARKWVGMLWYAILGLPPLKCGERIRSVPPTDSSHGFH